MYIDAVRRNWFWGLWFLGSLAIADRSSAAPMLKGDYNNNGVVDAADYVIWRDHLGADPYTLFGEGDGITPGRVTTDDHGFWQSQFGKMAGEGSALDPSGGSVPEPTSAALAILGAIGFYGATRRCRR